MTSIRSWWDLVWPERFLLALAMLALMGGSGLGLAAPQGVKSLIDSLSGEGAPEALDAALQMLLLVFLGVGILGFLRAWLFTWAGERVVAKLRKELFSKLISREIAFFDGERTGDLVSRLGSDTGVLQNAVTVNVSMALRFGIQALGSIGVLFWTSSKLTLLMLSMVPVVAIGMAVFGRYIRNLAQRTQDALAQASTVAEEVFSNVRTVRSFAREESETERYGSKVQEALSLGRKVGLAYGAFQGAGSIAALGAVSLVLWYGGRMVMDQSMTVGTLSSFMLYTFTLAFSLGALAGLYGDYQRAVGASQRVFELLGQEPKLVPGVRKLSKVEGRMQLVSLDFSYPARSDVPVLKNVELALEPGKVLALVGPSGGGKSTVAALLARFYDPVAGRVMLDGVDVRELEPDWLREQIGMVAQEPVLFAMSLGDNISYGRPGASDAEVMEAAKAANAHEFIAKLPEGYGTQVGERGVRLSGGQRQRIAIARALLKNPRVLILDEATSALDAESEHLVQEALERLMVGRTVLVIAHRLSTVKNADQVAVIEGGRVVEKGRHEELLSQDGLYRKLVERQFVGAHA
jgi:ATP-binding cassette subfamily B protein